MESLRTKKNLIFLIGVRSIKLYYKLVCRLLGLNFHKKLLRSIIKINKTNNTETHVLPDGRKHRENGPAYIEIKENKKKECWYWGGKLHRKNEPAIIKVEGTVIRELNWYEHGKLNRLDGPALLLYDENGNFVEAHWLNNGTLHREDGPAFIYVDHNIRQECWYLNGIVHRIGGPAETTIHGMIYVMETWLENGLRHRVNGPAHVMRYENGNISEEIWCLNGKYHRIDGPALIRRNNDGNIELEKWYIAGENIIAK